MCNSTRTRNTQKERTRKPIATEQPEGAMKIIASGLAGCYKFKPARDYIYNGKKEEKKNGSPIYLQVYAIKTGSFLAEI